MTPVTVSVVVVVVVVVVVPSSEVVAAVSDAVVESSVDAQELTPSARTVTRTRMNRKYRRKLKMDIILLHEGIKNPNCSVSIILPNQPLIFLRTIDLFLHMSTLIYSFLV